MIKGRTIICKTMIFVIVVSSLSFLPLTKVYADDPLIIVLDPGHGGENLGAEYLDYTEKNMTMILAHTMKEELEKYDNVEVYLTHETDVDMSIKDRAAFAQDKNADFLFCLHFNMSVHHNLFGAEVWVPATGSYFSKGYSFAEIQMAEFEALGLYSRGIKTKLNNDNLNYYGILRYCTENQIPSALIEHCHLDHPKDQPFYQSGEEQLKAFGRLDATAVAKYFKLQSTELGVDYSGFQVPECEIPDGIVRPDETAPELSQIEIVNKNEETGEITIQMKAEDADSYILYCNYSLDGGNTYSDLMEWPRPERWDASLNEYTFTITVPFGQEIDLRSNAYNGFDVWTESNVITIDAMEDPAIKAEEEKRKEEEAKKAYEEIVYDETVVTAPEQVPSWPIMATVAIIILLMLIVTAVLISNLKLLRKGKRKK